MQVTVISNLQVLEDALSSARRYDTSLDSRGLASPLDAALVGRIEEAWDTIEDAIRQIFVAGKQKAEELLHSALAKAGQLIKEAGRQATRVHDALLSRLQAFIRKFVEGMLARVPPAVVIAGRSFGLNAVKFNQKLVGTGSLSTNLSEAFSLVADGEIEVSAEYSAQALSTPVTA